MHVFQGDYIVAFQYLKVAYKKDKGRHIAVGLEAWF